jgi:hypothetical protein
VTIEKAEWITRTARSSLDIVLATAYISVAIQVIIDDSTIIWDAFDTLDDRM